MGSALLQETVARKGKINLIQPESSHVDASVTSQYSQGDGIAANMSYAETDNVSASTGQAESRTIALSEERPARSVLNEIVGDDGVLVISLASQPHRFAYTRYQLSLAGIQSTLFPATNPLRASDEELNQGCVSQKPNNVPFSETCYGCATKREQAIAESHRRALVVAANRTMEWTALLEDDMALVRPERWDSAFRRAWEQIPAEAKVVRLSWCMIVSHENDFVNVDIDTGDFLLSKWMSVRADNSTYGPGLCTGGYLVHRDIIPELLGLFPCCAPVDGQYALLQKSMRAKSGKLWGMEAMISMEAKESRNYIEDATKDSWLGQHGVMYQNKPAVVDLRERFAIHELESVLRPSPPAD